MRNFRMLLALPLLLPACSGECTDIGIPSGVSIAKNDFKAPQGATVEVCAVTSCGSAPVDAGEPFIDLPLDPDREVDLTVIVRDATARELARSEVTVRPLRQEDEEACDSGSAAQVMLELDGAGSARNTS